ncbi:MAG: hypothetical protein PVI89_17845, partial [Desulfobacteraceae bacterium]
GGVAGDLQYYLYSCAPGAFFIPLVFSGGLCRPPAFASVSSRMWIFIAAGQAVSSLSVCLHFSVMPGLTQHLKSYHTDNTGFRIKPGMTTAPNRMGLPI